MHPPGAHVKSALPCLDKGWAIRFSPFRNGAGDQSGRAFRGKIMDMCGKVALVTGGGARIGRALCEALAGQGCAVVVHYRRSRKEALELARRLEAAGGRARAIRGALDTQASCERLVSQAFKAFGRLDVLVNNASSFDRTDFRHVRGPELDSAFSINLKAPILLTRAFVARARRGRVLNLLDTRISGHAPGYMAYLLSKQGLADFTRAAALELAPDFTVNAVAPGPVLAPDRGSRSAREKAGAIPLRRRPSPGDVASAALFLLGGDAITGQIVYVDGGQNLL